MVFSKNFRALLNITLYLQKKKKHTLIASICISFISELNSYSVDSFDEVSLGSWIVLFRLKLLDLLVDVELSELLVSSANKINLLLNNCIAYL